MFHHVLMQMEEKASFYNTENIHEVYLGTYKTEMCGD